MKNKWLLLLVVILVAGFTAHAQIITTIAGDSVAGYNGDNIPAVSAELTHPVDIAFDNSGNVYIADAGNNRIRKIDASGIITTFAGTGTGGYNGDGIQATVAELYFPTSMTFDAVGNMYITDDYNNRIRKINTSGIISTIAGNGTLGFSGDNGMATLAQVGNCSGIAVDKSGNIYIDNSGNYRIRKISNSGIITTIAGNGAVVHSGDNGPATAATLQESLGLALDTSGNIYFAEYGGSCIRKISVAGIITTVIGIPYETGYSGDGGPATAAELYFPTGVSIDNNGNFYVSDGTTSVIRKVNADGIISTMAGNGDNGFNGDDGPATLAELNSPTIARADVSGNIYICDLFNNRVRFIKATTSINAINNALSDIKLYPNPCQGQFTVYISSVTNEAAQVSIYNAAGEKVKEMNIVTNTLIAVQLDVPAGIYFLSAVAANGRWNKELIVSR